MERSKAKFHPACPKCGKKPSKDPEAPSPVRGCCSFSYAQDPEYVAKRCRRYKDKPVVETEYGDKMTGAEFLEMLETVCPVRFTHSIGVWFS